MDPGALIDSVGLHAAAFVIALVGSIIPIISIELFFIAIAFGVPASVGAGDAVALCAIAAVGQVLGKLPIYYASRGVAQLSTRTPGRAARLARVRKWASRWHPGVLLATSSTLGLPPFSLLATAAGVLAIPPRTFCVVVAVGRAVRFATIFALATR